MAAARALLTLKRPPMPSLTRWPHHRKVLAVAPVSISEASESEKALIGMDAVSSRRRP